MSHNHEYIYFLKPSGSSSQQTKKTKQGPTKKLEGRFIITEVAPDGEPIAPEATVKNTLGNVVVLSGTTSLSALGYGKLTIQASKGMPCVKEKRSGSGGS